METIFDFNPTEEEIHKIIGSIPKVEYISTRKSMPITSAYDICYLLYRRKDARWRKYFELLTPSVQTDFFRMFYHP